MSRSVIIFFLIVSSCVRAEAQVSLNTLVQKYAAFKSTVPGVRIHFVFNQQKYAPGDTVFFKTYFLKEDLRPIEGRQLVDVSLVSPEGKELQHYLFAVTNGVGTNQLILPEILPPGIYNVGGYSSWMKNVEHAKAFTQELIVVGETTVEKSTATDSSPMRIAVTSSSDIRISSDELTSRYSELYVVVINNGKVIYSRPFVQGTRDAVSLNSKLLPGLNVIHVVNKLGREISTASHYIPERDSIVAKIKTRYPNLQTRRRAAVTVTVQDQNERPVEGEFSIKIFNGSVLDSTQMSFQRALASSGPTYEPWRQILGGVTKPRYNFKTDLGKKGVAYYADGVTPLPPLTRLFFYLQENDVMMQVMTVAGGVVKLTIPDINGNDLLFYMAEKDGEEIPNVKIIWEDTSIPTPAPPASTVSAEADLYGIFAANKRMIDQAFLFEEGDSVTVRTLVRRRSSELEHRLRGADITVHTEKFVTFATMEEMIHEIVPALVVYKSKGTTAVRVSLQKGVSVSDPLYIIDGIATKNTKDFLSLKPVDLDQVKVVTNPGKLATLGLMGREGLVIVETKTGNAQPKSDASAVVNGVNRPMVFKQAAYADKNRPNFRSTIYWNPSIKTDPTGKAIVEFECSDDLGPVYIRVDGMTTSGRPFSGEGKVNFVLTDR